MFCDSEKVIDDLKRGKNMIRMVATLVMAIITLTTMGSLLSAESDEVKWHDNCQTREEYGMFNTIIGKTVWVNDSDEQCKPIEEAKSLKNSPIKCVANWDHENDVRASCVDWNATHIKLILLNIKGKSKTEYPMKIISKEYNKSTRKSVDKVIRENKLTFDKDWSWKEITVEVNMGETIKIGENSTTIKLQDNETENLEDSVITSNNPDYDGGADYRMYGVATTSEHYESVIKCNISVISLGQNIEDASLYIWSNYEGIDSGEEFHFDAHHYYNQTWDESCTWNTMGADYNSTYESRWTVTGPDPTPDSPNWINWTVKNMVSKDYNDGKGNFSIWLKTVLSSGLPTLNDNVQLFSKEYNTYTSLRPYLNITYSEVVDTTKPTYSNNGHNTTEAGDDVLFYIKYNDDIALHPDGQYIFSTNNTGEWVNESAVNFTATPNWANVSMTLNSTSGLSVGYRWYADDNVGNTNDTEIFSLTTTLTTFVDIIPSQILVNGITFGADPGTNDNAANNNTACSTGTCYNISIDPATTVNIDIYNTATGDLTSGGSSIGIQNMTHQGNQTSSTGDNLVAAGSTSVTLSYALIVDCSNIPDSNTCYMRYWLDVPTGQNPGSYSSTYKYCAVETGEGSGDCT